jgi:DNA-binding MarR family transcriptional regulator
VVIDDLESQGLVRRRAHLTDRRAKMVEVTRKGRALAPEDVEQLARVLERVTGTAIFAEGALSMSGPLRLH